MKRRIPSGWCEYTNTGRRVAGTRFLPFKVPLKEELCRRISNKAYWFTPRNLIAKQPNLKVIIDLTNTKRYYDSQFFESRGIAHRKIPCEGQGKLPSETIIAKFFRYVDEFLENNKENDALIGVHCTHGLNRTGYLICKYLVDRMNISPQDAISRFEIARGHEICRPTYVNDLLGTVEATEKNENRKWRKQSMDNISDVQSNSSKKLYSHHNSQHNTAPKKRKSHRDEYYNNFDYNHARQQSDIYFAE